jgi:hypothetical protein
MKTCSKCKIPKELTEYHSDITTKDKKSPQCKVCRDTWGRERYQLSKKDPEKVRKMKEWQKTYYAAGKPRLSKFLYKKKLVDFFGGGCTVCGYNKCIGALEFHHKDPSEKEFNISNNIINGVSWDECIIEASKCLLVCNRCHREIHLLKNEVEYLQASEKRDQLKEARKQELENQERTVVDHEPGDAKPE